VATNVLTDRACRAHACPSHQKLLKLFDGHGLYLLVNPSGTKLWRMAYRLGGKPQTATFGPYPEVTLAEARKKRDEWRMLLRQGVNPKVAPAPAPEAPKIALREAMTAYWDARTNISDGYRQNAIRAFEMHLSRILDLPIAQIDRATLMEELRVMDEKQLFVYVRRTRMWAALVFDWAIEHQDRTGVTVNSAKLIKPEKAFGSAPVKPHAALALAEVPQFMQRLAAEDQAMQSVLACRLIALTWVRTQEARLMQWSEIEQDGTLWRIPAGKMKRRTEHLVPLSRQAQAIIETMRARSRGSNYVFPSDAARRLDRPMSENAVLYLIGRMGYEGRMTGHGWRSIASTWANECGRYGSDAIERQLAHTPNDKVRAAYNRAAYLNERTRMLQDWADWLDPSASTRDGEGTA
jgi:integrase